MSERDQCGNCVHHGDISSHVSRLITAPSLRGKASLCLHYASDETTEVWITSPQDWCGKHKRRPEEGGQ